MTTIEVDVWVRGTLAVKTRTIAGVPGDAAGWTDEHVRRLLTEMLLAIEREKNPQGEPPLVTLRGFSWIVSPDDRGGVILHLEMQMGTASAGPFAIDEPRLTALVSKAIARPPSTNERIH